MTLLLTIYGKRTRRVIICEEINTQKHKVKLIISPKLYILAQICNMCDISF